MSSLPPQRPPPTGQGRRQSGAQASSEQASFSQQQQPRRENSLSKSTSSVDSQTLLLNNPSERVDTQKADAASSRGDGPAPQDPQKCWICFADETEDSPTTSRWRSPCSCSLTAHESCLLDWVADQEAPSSRRGPGGPTKIQCPQCKNDIIIARPRNYVGEAVRTVEKSASRLIVPGIAVTLAGSIYTGLAMHGLSTVYLVFGPQDFDLLMGDPTSLSLKWLVGFPLIPFLLIVSRTSLADGVLPAMPVIFFIGNMAHPPSGRYHPSRSMSLWPPSAAMTLAMIPYVRGIYNELYRTLFAEREKRWFAEVQPRAGENAEGDGEEGHQHHHHHEEHDHGGIGFDWNLEVEIVEEEIDAVEQPGQPRPDQGQAQGQNAQANAPQEGGRQNDNQGQQGNQRANRRQVQNRQHPLVLTTARIAEVVMGALCFPAVASAMGELLRFGLPRTWTEPSFRRPGFLQTRWGRTVAGGCLFIVMKDTLLLYSKYRTAKDHKLRRIMNYDRATGRHVE